MTGGAPLTPTDLLAAASELLEQGGYTRVSGGVVDSWATAGTRLFEDVYNVVALVVYETWQELDAGWPAAQAELVELISAHMTRSDPKAWDVYLVLLTPGPAIDGDRGPSDIRYDTSRVRKLVAAGDELQVVGDVERALLPLLPLDAVTATAGERSTLTMLPEILAKHGVEPQTVSVVVEAFRTQRSLVESLHDYRTNG